MSCVSLAHTCMWVTSWKVQMDGWMHERAEWKKKANTHTDTHVCSLVKRIEIILYIQQYTHTHMYVFRCGSRYERVCACRSAHSTIYAIAFSCFLSIPFCHCINKIFTEHLPLFSTLIGQTPFSRFHSIQFSFVRMCIVCAVRILSVFHCLSVCSCVCVLFGIVQCLVSRSQVHVNVSMAMRRCVHCSRTVHHFSYDIFSFCRRRCRVDCVRTLHMLVWVSVCGCVRVYLCWKRMKFTLGRV